MRIFQKIDKNEKKFNAMFPGHKITEKNPCKDFLLFNVMAHETIPETTDFLITFDDDDTEESHKRFIVAEVNYSKERLLSYARMQVWCRDFSEGKIMMMIERSIIAASKFKVGTILTVNGEVFTEVK